MGNLPELLHKIYLAFSLSIQFYISRCSREIVWGKFSERLKLSGGFFYGREGFPMGEILHEGVFCGRYSSWRNSLQEKFSMEEFTMGEILHGRIFCSRNFPSEGWNFQKNLPSKDFSGMI